ncbi:hypothetical protein PBY51_005661 [Eleginops maclovinus]|uniref:Secreted protein n=1 Tax=Eleginops maclovinus TaxID=56733 RepID=A0AAN7WRV4_ELEMC|nr:hypothetical protein PBY51_005661 [Eleginops maclovinus]
MLAWWRLFSSSSLPPCSSAQPFHPQKRLPLAASKHISSLPPCSALSLTRNKSPWRPHHSKRAPPFRPQHYHPRTWRACAPTLKHPSST